MRYTIEIASSALKSLRALPRDTQAKIARAIDALAQNPYPPRVKKQGAEDTYRFRIGDYRVVYEIHGKRLVILIVGIGHRKDIHR